MTAKPKKHTLQHVDDQAMSIVKRPYGNGYQYFDENNERIKDKPLLGRIRKLIIPPMWSEVYICKWDDGHIQAIGRDTKGRKQYIYHSEWEKMRQEEKFAKMSDFGEALPALREKAYQDIKQNKWNKSRILSLLVMILDETGIRIGNRQYAKRNSTYGLTTLRRKHMTIDEDTLYFEYKGKSNKQRQVEIDDDELISLIKKTADLPGYELFRYKDSDGNFNAIDSDDVNEYIRNEMGENFSSKDFRTWVASRLAIELYPDALEKFKTKSRSKFSNILLRMVADELGNTPTVCKSYYVHPEIMQLIEKQDIPLVNNKDQSDEEYSLSAEENTLLDIISK